MSDLPTPIFLVGPMGAGKSAVGRRLAEDLGCAFVDSDEVIEQRTGVDIPYIFEKEGEAGFRARERLIIEELTQQPGIVLATGGGAIEDAESRAWLQARGTVVYLHATVEQQLRRTRRGHERPMLRGGEPREILARLLERRDPLYREIAHVIVETDGRRVTAVAREIRERVAEQRVT